MRRHRSGLGLTQEQLAERAGLSRNYISDVERGARNVTLYNVVRLAAALEIDPGMLVTEIEP